MLIYNELKNKPREFLAATGLKLDEFSSCCLRFRRPMGKSILLT